MASLKQAASILAERAEKKNDVSFIKEMKDLIIIKRARIIANSLSKNPSLAKYYLQRFNVPLIAVDAGDECNEDIAKCDKVFRTIEKVPESLRYYPNPFGYVGAPDGSHGWGWTTFGTEPKRRVKKLTGKFPRWTYTNGYIYIFNKDIPEVGIEDVFSDPRSVAKFKCGTDGKPCFSEESEFPIDEQTLELIIKDIMQNELRLSNGNNEKILIKEDKNV